MSLTEALCAVAATIILVIAGAAVLHAGDREARERDAAERACCSCPEVPACH